MSDEVKRYRAYLTRLTKWIVFDEATDRQVSREHVRHALVRAGELEEHLDDGWAKRVFDDAKTFSGEGKFFRIIDGVERGKTKPEWKGGPRPGEDVAGNTLRKLVGHVDRVDEPPWTNYRLANEAWDPVSRFCILALNHMRTRGVERPMGPLQGLAFAEALKSDHRALQTVALWLTTTRYYLDAYARVRAYDKGDGALNSDNELELYRPTHFRAKKGPDESLEFIEEEFTTRVALEVIREILVRRQILKEKRR